MKKLLKEFGEFINRGNVLDMAVGVIIGAAFTSIVTALTTNIINPLISMIGGSPEVKGMAFTFNGATVDFGAFISAVINFLIVAIVVFAIVKAFNKAQTAGAKLVKHADDEVVVAPKCPYCLEEVNVGATRCHHCGAELPEKAEAHVEKVK
ncbi:large conductance mechanosensitive channel protein MscL [bacterium]|nr:large conductance mechanosensitive channel protein MscL [bacterium]